VTKLDRFARTAADGAIKIKELFDKGINVHVLNMGLIENTATGKLIMQIFLAFAEFERDNIMARMNEGKAIARANDPNWREGRKTKEIDQQAFQKFRERQKRGEMTVEACCKELGISRSLWYKHSKDGE
jgi:DNA invertase Pin-like site-specific DNA recombinase